MSIVGTNILQHGPKRDITIWKKRKMSLLGERYHDMMNLSTNDTILLEPSFDLPLCDDCSTNSLGKEELHDSNFIIPMSQLVNEDDSFFPCKNCCLP